MGCIKYYPTTSVQHAFMYMMDSNVIWQHFVNGTDCLACNDASANAERLEKEMGPGLHISVFARNIVCHAYSKVNFRSRWLIHCYIRPTVRRTLLAVMSKTVQHRITSPVFWSPANACVSKIFQNFGNNFMNYQCEVECLYQTTQRHIQQQSS